MMAELLHIPRDSGEHKWANEATESFDWMMMPFAWRCLCLARLAVF